MKKMRRFLKDLDYNVINMYCVDCRIEEKPWEDSIAVIMCDNTTRCMEHFDIFIERNKINAER